MSSIKTEGLHEKGTPGQTLAGNSWPDNGGAGVPEPPPFSLAENRIPTVRCWGLAILAGLVAGVVSWLGGEAIYGRFIPPLIATSGFPTIEEIQAAKRARNAGVTMEAGLTAVMMGAALGLMLGLAGGGVRKSGRAAAIAGLAGLFLGGVGAAVATWSLMPAFLRIYDPDKDVLLVALLVHGSIATVIGAGVGTAFGAGISGGIRGERHGLIGRTILGGLLGAAAGMLIFQIVGMMVFPLDHTTLPVSKSSNSRLASHVLLTLLASAGAARGALQLPSTNKGHISS